MTRHKLTLQQLTEHLFEYVPWPVGADVLKSSPDEYMKRSAAQGVYSYNLLHAHLNTQLLLPVHDRTVLMTTEEIEKHIGICEDMIMLGTKRLMEL